ncbi:DsbA family protein [Lysobacter korlensis]|uniref:DsbA family protein n=1 Tax=Lysobacter korlensis TaxID=553636 RepID=A0ABV6RYB0_9GAMM
MTNAGPGDRLTKNQRREAAREKARQLRDQQKKKEKRNRILLQGGIIVGSLAIIAVIALVLVNSVRPAGPGPANMLSGGIRIGQDFEVVETAAMEPGATPTPVPPAEGEDGEQPINIQIFQDYFCPVCRAFDEANREQIASLIESGAVTYEIHPISFLDRVSLGTRYSSRAANAAACVADKSPNSFWEFDEAMFANQPAEQTAGLSNEELVDIALGIEGVQAPDAIEDCIEDEEFKNWVTDITAYAQNFGVPGTDVNAIQGTPTVLVNGLQYQGSPSDAAAFQAFVAQAEGQVFNEESTPTPTPTPTS